SETLLEAVDKDSSTSPAVEEEAESVPLPVGWRCYRSAEGRKYYVNTNSKETTWERPCAAATAPKPARTHKNS
ncbi:hypothetical protein NFI96_025590, partial [Prochilodus magdalenae]